MTKLDSGTDSVSFFSPRNYTSIIAWAEMMLPLLALLAVIGYVAWNIAEMMLSDFLRWFAILLVS